MSSYKEDINEAKERLKAWWDHEKTDRPCIIYWTPRPDIKYYKVEDIVEYFMPFFLAKNWDSPEFLGGNGAMGDYKTFRKRYRKTIRSSK